MQFMQGYTSLLSSAFYWWLNWIFKKGYKTALELSDLGSLSEVHTTKYQRDAFTRALKKEQVNSFIGIPFSQKLSILTLSKT